jgi:broad specificity phosphatase PhoE
MDPSMPAHQWKLGAVGIAGAKELARSLSAYSPTKVVASLEPKARETGAIVAGRLGVPFATALGLHEHDRRTVGFLGTDEFAARMRDLFARPEAVAFGNESAAAALARFATAVDRIVDEQTGNIVIVSHGTVIALFVGARADVDAAALWARLGLPSYVALEVPGFRIEELVASL